MLSEQLHQVRIASKKLRYALEIAADSGLKAALHVRALKRTQETGRLHDLQVLQRHVPAVQAKPAGRARLLPDSMQSPRGSKKSAAGCTANTSDSSTRFVAGADGAHRYRCPSHGPARVGEDVAATRAKPR